jgi:hypothetical protein
MFQPLDLPDWARKNYVALVSQNYVAFSKGWINLSINMDWPSICQTLQWGSHPKIKALEIFKFSPSPSVSLHSTPNPDTFTLSPSPVSVSLIPELSCPEAGSLWGVGAWSFLPCLEEGAEGEEAGGSEWGRCWRMGMEDTEEDSFWVRIFMLTRTAHVTVLSGERWWTVFWEHRS